MIIRGLIIAALVIVAVSACSSSSSSSTSTTNSQQSSQAQPSPVSTKASMAGRCVLGIYDTFARVFDPINDLASGADEISAGSSVAEAYQVTLANTSGGSTAQVTGFAVILYSQGRELTSDNERFYSPSFRAPGQSLTWTEDPWGTYTQGDASIGPLAAGNEGAVIGGATCDVLQWYS